LGDTQSGYSLTQAHTTGFVVSNHDSCIDTRRSVTGFIYYLGCCVFCWQSKQQTSVTLSSMDAEYMAAWAASQKPSGWSGYSKSLVVYLLNSSHWWKTMRHAPI